MKVGDWDAMPLALAVRRQAHLWDEFRFRTSYAGTPHGGVSDILLRYSAPDIEDPSVVRDDLDIVCYPAWHALPEARDVIFNLMRRFEAIALGRVIISRMASGGAITPHADSHGAYVQDGMRLHAVVQGLPGSVFHCGGESVQMLSNTVWWFNHQELHSVENQSADERIHLMVDLRTAPCSK